MVPAPVTISGSRDGPPCGARGDSASGLVFPLPLPACAVSQRNKSCGKLEEGGTSRGAAARPQPVSQRCLSTRGGRHRADAAAPRGTVLWLGGTQASDLWPFPGTSGNRSSGAGAGAWRGTRGPGRGGAGQGASRRSDGGTETALRLPGPGLAQAPDRLAHAARHPHGRTQDVEGRRTREQGPEA